MDMVQLQETIMFNIRRLVAASLGAAILATVTATAMAAPPAYVAPKGAKMKIKNVNCPGNADLEIIVWSKKPGQVKISLERKGGGILGSDTITTDTRVRGYYKGAFGGTIGLASTGYKTKYRIVATDGYKTRKSKWVAIKSCALVT